MASIGSARPNLFNLQYPHPDPRRPDGAWRGGMTQNGDASGGALIIGIQFEPDWLARHVISLEGVYVAVAGGAAPPTVGTFEIAMPDLAGDDLSLLMDMPYPFAPASASGAYDGYLHANLRLPIWMSVGLPNRGVPTIGTPWTLLDTYVANAANISMLFKAWGFWWELRKTPAPSPGVPA